MQDARLSHCPCCWQPGTGNAHTAVSLCAAARDSRLKKKKLIFHPILRKLKRYSIQKHLPTVSIKILPLSNKY